MPDKRIQIDGMHCGGCEDRVQRGLSRLEGVRSVEANHETGTATVALVAGEGDEGALLTAVEDLGYDVEKIETP